MSAQQLELPLASKKGDPEFDVDVATWIMDLLLEATKWDIDTAMAISKNLAPRVEEGKASKFEVARMTVALDRTMLLQGNVGGLQGQFPELAFVKNVIRFRHVTNAVRASRR